jgi:hypothetical protein
MIVVELSINTFVQACTSPLLPGKNPCLTNLIFPIAQIAPAAAALNCAGYLL